MYFPFLRGRQYELLALKELVQKSLLNDKIIPIVEPIKISSTLKSTLELYNKENKPLALVLNTDAVVMEDIEREQLYGFLKGKIIPAVLVNESFKTTIAKIEEVGFAKNQIIVVFTSEENAALFNDCFKDVDPLFCLGPDKRYFRKLETYNKVLFDDHFIKQAKNSDYLKKDDEFFSEDHLNYAEDGYSGFGDYSIIGKEYDDSGFAPRAVAIHIVYFDSSNILRIHHFVSDSNYGIEDVAGKFYEAIQKFEGFGPLKEIINSTSAFGTLVNYAKDGYYPGLPTLKKLSIMHHIELLRKFLAE